MKFQQDGDDISLVDCHATISCYSRYHGLVSARILGYLPDNAIFMKTKRRFGAFITFEGGEGSGKTTQIPYLAQYLRSVGCPVLVTKEPGGTRSGRAIRSILLKNTTNPIDSRCELFLYLADRAQHITEVVRPALEAGKIVICDRHADATMAYQAFGRKLNLKFIATLNHFATGGLKPALTFLLDQPPEVGLARCRNRELMNRLDLEELTFHRRVRRGYRKLARSDSERIRVIDAKQTPEKVEAAIQRYAQQFFKEQLH
tara:strand:- start:21 stop:797 length:777 start_codon:yes stop_codon:yes gene_type:complete